MITRREFSKAALCLPAACATLPRDQGRIDSHSHSWDSSYRLRPERKGRKIIPKTFSLEKLMQLGKASSISRFVLIQHIANHGFNSDYLCEAVTRFPGRFAVVGALDPQMANPAKAMVTGLQRGISGYGGVCLILGLATRWMAALQLPILFGAIFYVHLPELWRLEKISTTNESLFAFSTLALLLFFTIRGAGCHSMDYSYAVDEAEELAEQKMVHH